MRDTKVIIVDENIDRQKALNEERNPRQTIYGEATQKLNPLTGRVYEDQFTLEEIKSFNEDHLFSTDNLSEFYNIKKTKTNDFIEYQLSLARMDVRDGKMTRAQFFKDRDAINKMVKRMNEANVPLDMLSSVRGLNSAIEQIQTESRVRGIFADLYLEPKKSNPDKIYGRIGNIYPIKPYEYKIDKQVRDWLLRDSFNINLI